MASAHDRAEAPAALHPGVTGAEGNHRTTGPQPTLSAANLVDPADSGRHTDREEMLLDALPQPAVLGYFGEELQLNAAARDLFGREFAERLISVHDLEALLGGVAIGRAIGGERPAPENVEVQLAGEKRTLTVEAAPIFSHGRQLGVVATFRDITDRILDDDMGDDLLGRAAHDLRTPLTALKASAQLIGRGFDRLDENARTRTLNLLLAQIDKLTSRIDDVLDAARIRRGRIDMQAEEVDVAEELASIVRAIAAVPGAPGIELAASEALFASVDRARLRQVIQRLAFELAECTPGGAIEIAAKPVGKSIEISVQPLAEATRKPKKQTARRLAAVIAARLGGAFHEEGARVSLALPRAR